MSPKERMVLYKSRKKENPLFHKIEGKKNPNTEPEIARKIFESTKHKIKEIQSKFNKQEKGLILVDKKFIFDVNKNKFVNDHMYGSYRIDVKAGCVYIDIVLDEKMVARKIDLKNYLGGDKEYSQILETINHDLEHNKNEKHIDYYEFHTPGQIFKGRLKFKENHDFLNTARYKKE